MKSSSSNYDYAGLLLGTGSLLAWLGVLRYIGFFKQFNVRLFCDINGDKGNVYDKKFIWVKLRVKM
jgi:hypothetical protein